MVISELISIATQRLANVSDSPRLDAEILLCHVLDKSRSYLLTWPDKVLAAPELAKFNALLEQREKGRPIAHITGQREFWSLDLQVSSATLIPRPETELLVEQILNDYPDSAAITVADLGTGTGAIALALASERPRWKIIATDRSAEALDIARNNAKKLNLYNIEFRCGSWFEPLDQDQFDIIVSNPPYIPDADPHLSTGDVRFEPHSALASGHDGLDDIRIIAKQASQHLKIGGLLILEHGYDQQTSVHEIFTTTGYRKILQSQDLANLPRITSGIKA